MNLVHFRRLLSVWHARNLEFLRDRSALIFTLLLPIGMIIGMSFILGGKERPLFKVGVVAAQVDKQAHPFLRERFVEFVPMPDQAVAIHKVARHDLDLLLDVRAPVRYWVNPS